jgi:tetratricopeptide (TPR) repeat protein
VRASVAGLLHRAAGLYDRALDDYRPVLELEPRNAETLLRMASVYDLLDDPERALETYQKAIGLEPEYYEPYYQLGIFHYYHGKYPEAIQQFKEAIRRAPRLYEAYTNLGAALNYLGRDSEAEQALRTSLSIKETPRALNSMGARQAYRGHDSQALSFYERAISINPRNYIYLVNLGDAYRRLNRIVNAKIAYQKGIDIALTELNDDPRAGLTRAYVAYFAARLGDAKRAEQEIEQSVQLSPGDTMVQRKAVLTYVALGQPERALDALRGASPEVLQELARHPDLADFCRDSRFNELLKITNGGK